MKVTNGQLKQIIGEVIKEYYDDDHDRPFDEKRKEFEKVMYDLSSEVAAYYKSRGATQEESGREILEVLNAAVGIFEEGAPDGMDVENVLLNVYDDDQGEGDELNMAARFAKKGRRDFGSGDDTMQEKKKKWAKKAAASIEKKGTEGEFTKYCGGDVTQSCVDSAAKGDSTKRKRQAAFAANIDSDDDLVYPKEKKKKEKKK